MQYSNVKVDQDEDLMEIDEEQDFGIIENKNQIEDYFRIGPFLFPMERNVEDIHQKEQFGIFAENNGKKDLQDLLTTYGIGRRSIILTKTRMESEKIGTSFDVEVINGYAGRRKKEEIIQKFNSDIVSCIVATDNALRNLDIHFVDLVLQCGLRQDQRFHLDMEIDKEQQ